jgi:hypothetical protein
MQRGVEPAHDRIRLADTRVLVKRFLAHDESRLNVQALSYESLGNFFEPAPSAWARRCARVYMSEAQTQELGHRRHRRR